MNGGAAPGGVLRDPEHDVRLARDGYTVIPVLTADEVAELRAAYHAEVPVAVGPGGMRFDYMQDDREAMRRVTEVVTPVWERVVPRTFTDHRVVFSTFVHKHPGPQSGMFLHDDRTFVDESVHRAHTMWVALVDTSPELGNGHMQVVPGSHRLLEAASGSNTPDWIRPYEDYLRQHLCSVTVPAGHALVYDSKTLHCSPPNETDEVREAVAVAIAPRAAELRHVVADGDERTVYAVDPAFFVEVHPHEVEGAGMPAGYEVVERYVEEHPHPTPAEVAAVCDPDGPLPVPTGDLGAEPTDEGDPERRNPVHEGRPPPAPTPRCSLLRRVARRLR